MDGILTQVFNSLFLSKVRVLLFATAPPSPSHPSAFSSHRYSGCRSTEFFWPGQACCGRRAGRRSHHKVGLHEQLYRPGVCAVKCQSLQIIRERGPDTHSRTQSRNTRRSPLTRPVLFGSLRPCLSFHGAFQFLTVVYFIDHPETSPSPGPRCAPVSVGVVLR